MTNFRQRLAQLLAADMMTDRLSNAIPADMITEIYSELGDRAQGESHEEWFRRGGRSLRPGLAFGRFRRAASSLTLPPELFLELDGYPGIFGDLYFKQNEGNVKVTFVARHPDDARNIMEGLYWLKLLIVPEDGRARKELCRLALDRLQMVAEGEVSGNDAVQELSSAKRWDLEW